MSIRIDDNRPFTDEEKEWLLRDDSSSNKQRIAVNDRRFGHLTDEEKDALRQRAAQDEATTFAVVQQQVAQAENDFHPEDYAKVLPLDMAGLREALKREGQDDSGDDMQELQLRLLEYYDDKRNQG